MSQAAALRAIDADMVAAFADCGMADAATYQAPDGVALVPCTVLFDQPEMVRDGSNGPVVGTRTEISLQIAEVGTPQRGGRVVIDGVSWRLDDPIGDDASMSRWVVVRDRA